MLKIIAIGHLGKDATANNVNGKTVINFSIAHTEKYKDQQGNNQQKTVWVDCAWWSDRTAIVPYLTKGSQVYVEGIPEVKTFAKQDGTTGVSFVCRVGAVTLLGGNSNGNGAPNANNQTTTAYQSQAASNAAETGKPVDDLPF